MVLPIVQLGDKSLLKKSKPVDLKEKGVAFNKLLEDMVETMYLAKGIGLAAVQVGLLKRLFVVDIPDVTQGVMVFINPVIKKFSQNLEENEEGCLSIPGIKADVMRPGSILVHYLDQDFKPQEGVFDGILSVCVQHECDHLDGILFLERIKRKDQKNVLEQLVEKDFPEKSYASIAMASRDHNQSKKQSKRMSQESK